VSASREDTPGLEVLEQRLGHQFADPALLERALTHTSRAHEAGGAAHHNEPLEFLGDAVLGFLVSELLHRHDPEGQEGTKSRARAALVSAPDLARRAAALGIPEQLRLGRGEEKSGGRENTTLWADAYEAVVAALYLDGGLEAAQRFVAAQFGADIEEGWPLRARDHKSALQELLQGRGEPAPDYVLEAEEGPSHRPLFRVRCVIQGRSLALGEGPSKKQAQQVAARRALEKLAAESADDAS
jgi:ribonuclease-3